MSALNDRLSVPKNLCNRIDQRPVCSAFGRGICWSLLYIQAFMRFPGEKTKLKALSSSAQPILKDPTVTTTPHPVAARFTTSSKPETRVDTLFEELDGRDIYCGTSHWLTCVLGIHTEGDEAWVQLSLAGESSWSLVVHLLPRATGRQAIAAIDSWLDRRPADRPRIMEVASQRFVDPSAVRDADRGDHHDGP